MTEYKVGDAVAIADLDGVWIVIRTETQQVAANKALTGSVRVQKVFDGAGPTHLSANADITALHPVEDNPTPETADAERAPQGIRLDAANGTVIIPRHPDAYSSNASIVGEAWRLLRDVGLDGNPRRVEYVAGTWGPLAAPDVEAVPDELLDEVAHDHTYYDDGERPVVGPCRDLQRCSTSIHRLDARAQRLAGEPRFAELDTPSGPGVFWLADGDDVVGPAVCRRVEPLIRFLVEEIPPRTFEAEAAVQQMLREARR